MRKDEARTEGQALVYLTDCTLATVCAMAAKRSRSASEFQRQISIAQFGVDRAREFKLALEGTRLEEVGRFKDVQSWAAQFYAP